MSKQWLVRKGLALVAGDEKALKAIKRLGEGELVQMMMERSRSPDWHRWFMAGCAAIAQNSDEPMTTHAAKELLKLKAGHFDPYEIHGEFLKVPKSIAFEKLTADEWAELWPSLDRAAREHFKFDFELFKQGMAGFYE